MAQQEWAALIGLATAVIWSCETFWILKIPRDDRRRWRRVTFSAVVLASFAGLVGWMALAEPSSLVVLLPA